MGCSSGLIHHNKKKQPQRPPVSTSNIFGNDEDDDVNEEIARQATKKKVLKDIEEQHKKAMEEDPSVFDYDGVYDQIQEAKIKPLIQDRKERKSKYIETPMEKAKQRDMEHEIIYERKLVNDRSKEDHLYAGKDKFVTGAYKRKLAEQVKWIEEERLRELREEKGDVTKKSDLSDFYFNLSKNVAFGGKATESRELNEQHDSPADTSEHKILEAEAPPSSFSTKDSDEAEVFADPENNAKLSFEETKPPSTSIDEGKAAAEQLVVVQTKVDYHKRSKDVVAAAKERYLVRKKLNNNRYRLLSTTSIDKGEFEHSYQKPIKWS